MGILNKDLSFLAENCKKLQTFDRFSFRNTVDDILKQLQTLFIKKIIIEKDIL